MCGVRYGPKVLLEDFPVRGGFSEIYTSHELYCYKLKEATKEMLCAQGQYYTRQLDANNAPWSSR